MDLRLRAMSLSSCLETLAGVTCCGSLNIEIKNKMNKAVFFPLEAWGSQTFYTHLPVGHVLPHLRPWHQLRWVAEIPIGFDDSWLEWRTRRATSTQLGSCPPSWYSKNKTAPSIRFTPRSLRFFETFSIFRTSLMPLLSQIPMGSRSAWAQSNGVMDLAVLVRWIFMDIQLKADCLFLLTAACWATC